MTAPAQAAWIENPYGLVSLWEMLMPRNADDATTTDEFIFGRFANVLHELGVLDQVQLTPTVALQISFMLKELAKEAPTFGFHVSAKNAEELAQILDGHHYRTDVRPHSLMLRQSIMIELESTLFLHVPASVAHYFRDPRTHWEEVIERFPDTVSDIEEAGKCLALRRYPATVFHSMQVLEHGLLALGTFMGIDDPKSGFTAVANGLQRVKATKYNDLTEGERENFAFLEQMNASVQAIKDAWRNKINHAQGRLTIMTADFSPQVTEEIYMATRAFMRRLATDLPKSGGKAWNPFRR